MRSSRNVDDLAAIEAVVKSVALVVDCLDAGAQDGPALSSEPAWYTRGHRGAAREEQRDLAADSFG